MATLGTEAGKVEKLDSLFLFSEKNTTFVAHKEPLRTKRYEG